MYLSQSSLSSSSSSISTEDDEKNVDEATGEAQAVEDESNAAARAEFNSISKEVPPHRISDSEYLFVVESFRVRNDDNDWGGVE